MIRMVNRTGQRRLLFVVTIFVLVVILVSAGPSQAQRQDEKIQLNIDPRHSRERIQENHQRRRDQLKKLLDETRQKVDDHESNRKLLSDEDEYNLLKKRIGLYQQKLEKMQGPLDDREIDRLMEREKMRSDRFRQEL